MLHIDIPTLEEFKALAQIKGETCVSLYLPTSSLGSNVRLNRTAFKDLVKEAPSQLSEGAVDKTEIAAFEEQFDRLAGAEHDVQDGGKIRSSSAQSRIRSIRSGISCPMDWRCSPRPPRCERSACRILQSHAPKSRIAFI
jgi:hypothetical protein